MKILVHSTHVNNIFLKYKQIYMTHRYLQFWAKSTKLIKIMNYSCDYFSFEYLHSDVNIKPTEHSIKAPHVILQPKRYIFFEQVRFLRCAQCLCPRRRTQSTRLLRDHFCFYSADSWLFWSFVTVLFILTSRVLSIGRCVRLASASSVMGFTGLQQIVCQHMRRDWETFSNGKRKRLLEWVFHTSARCALALLKDCFKSLTSSTLMLDGNDDISTFACQQRLQYS